MKRSLIFLFAIIVFVSLCFSSELTLDVKEHTLSNGMKILMILNLEFRGLSAIFTIELVP